MTRRIVTVGKRSVWATSAAIAWTVSLVFLAVAALSLVTLSAQKRGRTIEVAVDPGPMLQMVPADSVVRISRGGRPKLSSRRVSVVDRVAIGTREAGPVLGRIVAVAVGPRGEICVADRSRSQLLLYDAAGHFVRTVGRQGSGPGEFQNPSAVCFGPDGALYVADPGTGRISIFSHDGKFVRSVPLPSMLYFHVWSIVVGPAGRVLVSSVIGEEPQPASLAMLSSDGRTVAIGGGTPQPRSRNPVAALFLKPTVSGSILYRQGQRVFCLQQYPPIIYSLGDSLIPRKAWVLDNEWLTRPRVRVEGGRMGFDSFAMAWCMAAHGDTMLVGYYFGEAGYGIEAFTANGAVLFRRRKAEPCAPMLIDDNYNVYLVCNEGTTLRVAQIRF